jgi:phosphatidylserine/phosphatidylglycerophosphate/cardiolipin synthase-like enzyme
MIPSSILHLSSDALRSLKSYIAEENNEVPSRGILRQILGSEAHAIHDWLVEFRQTYGMFRPALEVVDAILQSRENHPTPESLFDLILSGPELKDVPTCETLPTIHHLIHEAKSEILICDYAVFGAESIFVHLREAISQKPELRVRLILHLFPDTAIKDEKSALTAFRDEFLRKHWKAERSPEIYVDPRSLNSDTSTRASMHAKCFVGDSAYALITSANLTDAGHRRNIEAGVAVKYPPMVKRLIAYFDGLIDEGILRRVN